MTKLRQIPKGSKIYGLEPDGDKDGVVIFDHLYGPYSYCYIEGSKDKIIHLSKETPLIPFEDGYRLEEGK